MKVESVAISSLVQDPSNARKHNQKNLEAIKGSLARFGQQKPIVVGKNNVVIAGNGTLAAAQALGWEKINVVKTALEGSDLTAYAIADNRTGELAEWDDDVLGRTLAALKDENFDLGSIGFDDDDLAQWLKTPEVVPGCDEDEVPETPKEAKTKPGDLYILGNHRLLCGDSTNVQHVERLMGGEKADLLFTDPPYGDWVGGMALMRKGERIPGKTVMKRVATIKNDGAVTDFSEAFVSAHTVLTEDAAKLVFFKWNKWEQIKSACEFWGEPSSVCVWDRVHNPTAFHRFVPNHEFCFHWGNLEDKKEPIKVMNVWSSPKELDGKEMHPTVKPIAILEPAIRVTCSPRGLVLDLFLGSGSTLIACEKTNRRCFGMEIDCLYADVIVERWMKFTGKMAYRINEDGSKTPWPELA